MGALLLAMLFGAVLFGGLGVAMFGTYPMETGPKVVAIVAMFAIGALGGAVAYIP